MDRETLIKQAIKKLNQLPESKIQEINDYADFLLSKLDDIILQEGIQKLVSDSKSLEYLKEEEELYSVNDLKERYK